MKSTNKNLNFVKQGLTLWFDKKPFLNSEFGFPAIFDIFLSRTDHL